MVSGQRGVLASRRCVSQCCATMRASLCVFISAVVVLGPPHKWRTESKGD